LKQIRHIRYHGQIGKTFAIVHAFLLRDMSYIFTCTYILVINNW